jgi:hypothetical protein
MMVAAVSSTEGSPGGLMRVAAFAIALVIAVSVSLAGQPGLKSFPLSFEIDDAPLSEVLDFIGRMADLDIQIDDAVPREVLDRKMKTVAFHNTDVEMVLKLVTSHSKLTFDILDENSIYIRVEQ